MIVSYGKMFVNCFSKERRAILCAAFVLSAGRVLAGNSGDSAPVLVSRTGGQGGGWATTAELKKAAEAHNPKACAQYGDALLRGDEVIKNTALAIQFLTEAASAGEANAAFRLGKIYDDGEYAPQDYAKAFQYYGAAAKAGVVEAQYNLGVLYVSARGTKRDYVEGLAWLIVATKNGAKGDGEQKTREQIQKIKRPQFIAEAEKRAAEILNDPAAAAAGIGPSGPGTPPKQSAPVKVDLSGEKPAPAKISVTPPGSILAPNFTPLLPPAVPPSAPSGTEGEKTPPKSQG